MKIIDYINADNISNEIASVLYIDNNYFNKYLKTTVSSKKLYEEGSLNNKNPIIFLTKIEYLHELNNKVLCNLKKKFIIITHYGDLRAGRFPNIIDNPFLIRWYGINMNLNNEKLYGLPIGLETKYWNRTNTLIIDKLSSIKKNKLLYLNFSNTNQKRPKIMKELIKKGFIRSEKLKWEEYMADLASHKFCISPQGNGIDCHRTWECLYLGVIPIVEKSIALEYFKELPILFVENYNQITKDFLEQKYKEFSRIKFNKEKLILSYWKNRIFNEFL